MVTTKLHETEMNLQFVVQPRPVAKTLKQKYTALAKTNETTALDEIN